LTRVPKFRISPRKFEKSTVEFIIEETNLGEKIIFLSPYYIYSLREFGFLVDFGFRKQKNVSYTREIQKLSLSLDKNYRSNKAYYSDKYKIISNFLNSYHDTIFPIHANNITIGTERQLCPVEVKFLDKKTYLFKGGSQDLSQYQGIRKYGPYEGFSDDIIYPFIFEDKYATFANDIFRSLAGKSNPDLFVGMQNVFNVPFYVENMKRIKLENLSIESLENAKKEVSEIKHSNPNKKVICIFIEPRDIDRDGIPEGDSPYFSLKYFLTKIGVPLQVVSYEKLRNADSLKWATANIGLALFAKLGGIPWLVKPATDDCLILGIGSAHEHTENGSIKKHFAYTVCLDSSGLYKKVDIISDSDNYESYLDKFTNGLISVIKEYPNYRKCSIHLPFKIKRKEISAIKAAIEKISDVEFTVIKINTANKFFGYSQHNTLIPYESSYVELGHNEYLVWFEGLKYGKENVCQRTANPVHVQFLRLNRNEEINIRKYLQDVINLSGANWRGFNHPVDHPELIFGTDVKLKSIDTYFFYTSQLRELSLLDDCKLIVTIGYSFLDEYVNDILAQSLKQKSNRTILSIAPYNLSDDIQKKKEILSRLKLEDSVISQIEIVNNKAKDFLENELTVGKILPYLKPEPETPF
jgi:hypothetical protein